MWRNLFKTLDKLFGYFEDWSLFLSVTTALVVALANIVLRKSTANLNLYWSDEVVRKVIFFTTYFGCVAAIRGRSLIRIDVLIQMVPVTRRFLTLVNHLSVLLFTVLLVYLGGLMTVSVYRDEYARTPSLQIPEWYFYAVLPLVGAMMLVRTVIVAFEDWTGRQEV